MSCPECHGEGRVTVGGYSVSPFSGVLVSDPQEAHDELCPVCGGSGLRASRCSLPGAQTEALVSAQERRAPDGEAEA